MRILMISDVYFPRINGVSTSIQTFRQELHQLGHETTLIAPDYDQPSSDEHGILRTPSRFLIVDPEDRLMRYHPIMRLIPDLKQQNFDLVHIQTPFVAHYAGLKLARQLGLPTVETYHTLFEEYLFHYIPFLPKSLLRFFARRLTCKQCNQVDTVIVPSTPMLEILRSYGVRTPIKVIPTGIQSDRFHGGNGETFRRKLGIAPNRPVLVHVGRIAHEKNIGFLLQVVKQVKNHIPDVILLIAGEGPALVHLKKQSADLGLQDNTKFIGYLSRDNELLDCYRAGDAFVFSSRTETQGLVLLEAMALGVPVVSTAIRGTKDILKANSGALVAEDDIEDFTNKVVTLLLDPALRKKLSAEAVRYAGTWSAQALAQKMADFYADIVSRKNHKK